MGKNSAIADIFRDELKRDALFVAVSLVALIVSALFEYVLDDALLFSVGDHDFMLSHAFAWVTIILCGVPILLDAATGLLFRHDIKADVLVAMALIACLIRWEFWAGGEVAWIMALGGLLEDYSAHRSNQGIDALVDSVPTSARAVRGGKEVEVQAKDVRVGETVRVLPGETVPLDGKVVSGRTAVDQASLTGESLPVEKGPGDEVLSGTVNQMGAFDMEVVRDYDASAYQKLVGMVRSADADRTRIVRLADRWATYLVAIVFFLAIGTWAACEFVFGVSDPVGRALTVMIVFCPCAFILATPTAVVAAIGNLSKRGILVRDGDAIEKMASVDRIAFDKTGTLTEGRPKVVSLTVDGVTEAEALSLAGAAEARSEHPLARAVVAECAARGASRDEPESFEVSVGGGVRASVGGRKVLAGSLRFVQGEGAEVSEMLVAAADRAAADGGTAIVVSADGRAVAVIGVSDTLRDHAADAVASIRENGAEPVLLTGDMRPAAEHVAAQVGISDIRAQCLPGDKMEAIEAMKGEGHHVCMIGDGINDAPALKTADVGIAMGATGSGMAVSAADMVLVGDDIAKMPHLQAVSSMMMHKIRTNIAFSMCWNAMAVALAMFGVVGPVVGAVIHNVGSVAVVVNSFLLLLYAGDAVSRNRSEREPPEAGPSPAAA